LRNLTGGDISLEEADNLYLLFKMYQALQTMASRTRMPLQQEIKNTTRPGLNALRSWYKAVETTLRQNKRGNFIYTLPNGANMNLYQIGTPIKRCLNILPKEPTEVIMHRYDELDVEDNYFDISCATKDEHVYYASNRYGFFMRNNIDLSPWKTVAKYEGHAWKDIFENDRGSITLGKLHFAKSLGIEYVIIDNAVAVKEGDCQKILEILNLPNRKIMQAAELAVQKDLEEAQKELAKSPNDEILAKEKALRMMSEDNMALEYITKGVEIAYRAQKDQEEYLEDSSWMEIDR